MTAPPKHFHTRAPIQASWYRASCELAELRRSRWLRDDSSPMHYRLAHGGTDRVMMVRWTRQALPTITYPLDNDCSLRTLGALADQPDEALVAWTSQWGLLGFRLQGEALPPPWTHVVVPGADTQTWKIEQEQFAYEPLELIREGAQVAQIGRAHV